MAWVRARIGVGRVAIVRATSTCIRGQRRKPGAADGEGGFGDAAALGPLLNGGPVASCVVLGRQLRSWNRVTVP